MSTSLLVAKERQPGSPFGLGQKQAKNLWRKRATVARYSILYRFLWNALQRDDVQPGPGLAFGLAALCRSTTTVGTASIHHAQATQMFGEKASVSGLERGPGCHPERSEGSLRPASQTLRCAQGDRPYLQMSVVGRNALTYTLVFSTLIAVR